MKVAMISCWYSGTVYGVYTKNLKKAIEIETGNAVKGITSTCACPPEHYTLIDDSFDYVGVHYFGDYPSNHKVKYHARMTIRRILEGLRGKSFIKKAKHYDILHMQQVLHAFGFRAVESFLKTASNARKIVTVHELDPIQKTKKHLNTVYNRADAIVVHTEHMKNELQALGVHEKLLQVIYYGTPIQPLENAERNTAIFYGGHHLTSGKGFDDLLEAIKILKENGKKIPIYIYGNFDDKEQGVSLSKQMGVNDSLIWQEQVGSQTEDAIIEWYQKSIFSVIPFTRGSACNPLTYAMANASPIIATAAIGIPEYLNDCGLLVNPNSPAELAKAMEKLLADENLRTDLGARGRKKAIEKFAWDIIGKQTTSLYEQVLTHRTE